MATKSKKGGRLVKKYQEECSAIAEAERLSEQPPQVGASENEEIRVTVEDSGRGFDPEKISEQGFGLRSM